MKTSSSLIATVLSIALAFPVPAQVPPPAPAAPAAAIDKATRDVTLKGSQGNEVTVTAGPDVENFDSIKVGDQVNVEYIEALTLELKKGGGQKVALTEQADAVGAKPGGCRCGTS